VKHFEQERQEWLAAGMNEADIFRIHHGELEENGRGGDYRIWLDERKHTRSDHKYAKGESLSFCDELYDEEEYTGNSNEIERLELSIDLAKVLSKLTERERFLVAAVYYHGRSYSEIAKEERKHRSTIMREVKTVTEKFKQLYKIENKNI